MRIREYEYLRDLMKKLLYSLEQVNMQQIDQKGLDALALSLNNEASGQGQGYQGEVTTSLSQRVGDSSKLPEV